MKQHNISPTPFLNPRDHKTPAMENKTTPVSEHHHQLYPIVNFSPEELHRLRADHELSVFIKVVGIKVNQHKLFFHFQISLSPTGILQIIPLENDFFLLKFQNSSDYRKAMNRVPWMINGHYIAVYKWVPNFNPSKAIITRVAIWVNLPGIPIEYYNEVALSRIAATIGKLVRIHPVTETKTACKYARLCIEIDLTCKLPRYIKLPGEFWQEITYEKLHTLFYQPNFVEQPQENSPYVLPVSHKPIHNHHVSFQSISESSNSNGVSDQQIKRKEGGVCHTNEEDIPRKSVTNPVMPAEPGGKNLNDFKHLRNVNDPLVLRDEFANFEISTDSSEEFHNSNTFSSQNPPIPSTWDAILQSCTTQLKANEFYLKVVQSLTKKVKIDEPFAVEERSTEGHPSIFTMDHSTSEFDISVNILPQHHGNGNRYQIAFNPKGHFRPRSSPINVLNWNCRGASDPKVICAMKDLCKQHKPSLVLLFETRVVGNEACELIEYLGFSNSYFLDPVGFTGGFWLLWHKEEVTIEITSTGSHQILANVLIPHELDDDAELQNPFLSWD